MNNKNVNKLFLVAIFLIGLFLRFYNLSEVPAGLHGDAASQGYNAFSILKTGMDRYGESFPILFRSLGSYQPPLYTYLTTISVLIFGNTVFAARFISALSGSLLILVTYFFVNSFSNKKNNLETISLFAAGLVSISPWAIFFSRLTVEANLGLLLFVTGLFLFSKSRFNIKFLPLACLVLGLSTHAYYSERLISIIFIPAFLYFFKDVFWKKEKTKWIAVSLIIFIFTLIPHIFTVFTGAFSRRFDQVASLGGFSIFEFVRKYLDYFLPKNLFFELPEGRLIPKIGPFYLWMIIPLLVSVFGYFKGKIELNLSKILLLLAFLTSVPAALTGDFFYPLRALEFLWIISIVISVGLGIIYASTEYKYKFAILIILCVVALVSLKSFYTSYFFLFRYGTDKNYGYSYVKLVEKLSEYSDKKIIIDSARDTGIGVRLAYLLRYDPNKMQEMLKSQMKSPYYSGTVNTDEVYKLDNIEVRPMVWGKDVYIEEIIVGDLLAISQSQVDEHKLKLEFEIPSADGAVYLRGYSTNPEEKCLSPSHGSVYCDKAP